MSNNLDNLPTFDCYEFVKHVAKHQSNAKPAIFNCLNDTFIGLEIKRRLFDYVFFLPFGLYTKDINVDILKELLNNIKKSSYSNAVVNLAPTNKISFEQYKEISRELNFDIIVNHCHLLQTNKSIDDIFNNFSDTRKKHIRRYLKAGIINVFSTNDKKFFIRYYDLYSDSMKRWGVSKGDYSREFISGLHNIPGIKMWVAEINGEMVSGMICIYYKNGVFDWLAASLINDDLKKSYPAVAVQYEVIKNACEKGLGFVNMGASENLNGVSDFKDSWGTEVFKTISFSKKSFLFKNSKKIYNFINKIHF